MVLTRVCLPAGLVHYVCSANIQFPVPSVYVLQSVLESYTIHALLDVSIS